MTVTVNAPPPPRPTGNPDVDRYLSELYRWAFDLWRRTGGDADIVSTGAQEGTSVSFINIIATSNITVGGTVDSRDIAADGTKLDGIEAGADVTDAANVTAAGAVMSGGDGIAVASNVASVDLAASPGLEFSAGKLRLKQETTGADTVATGSVSVNIGGTIRKLLFA